jgi:hypothetical protein
MKRVPCVEAVPACIKHDGIGFWEVLARTLETLLSGRSVVGVAVMCVVRRGCFCLHVGFGSKEGCCKVYGRYIDIPSCDDPEAAKSFLPDASERMNDKDPSMLSLEILSLY